MNLRFFSLPKIPTANRFYLRIPFAVFLVSACLTAPISQGGSTPDLAVLSLEQAVQLTLEQHPQLGVFTHRREGYQGLIEQAGASARPTIGLTVEDFAGGGETSGFDSAQSTLSINWVIEGSRIDQRIESAQVAASQIDTQRQIKALDLSAQTARLFIQALVQEQRLTLVQQASEQAKKTVDAIKKRVVAGKSPDFERLLGEVEMTQKELEAEDLQHELASTRYQLRAQWGGERNDFRLMGKLLTMPKRVNITQQFEQLKQNPTLALLATQQRITESEIELARIEAKPQWRFSVGVRRSEASDNVGMVAGVSVPFGKERSSTGKIRSLQARQAEFASESKAFQRLLDTQLYVLLQEIQHSHHVIETLQERIIPALDSAHAQATQAYETGRLSYQQWATLLNKKLGMQQELLSAFEAFHLQHIELQRLTGTTLTF